MIMRRGRRRRRRWRRRRRRKRRRRRFFQIKNDFEQYLNTWFLMLLW